MFASLVSRVYMGLRKILFAVRKSESLDELDRRVDDGTIAI